MIVEAHEVEAGKKLEGPNCLRSLRGTEGVEATGGETDLVELAERLDSHPIFFIFNDQLICICMYVCYHCYHCYHYDEAELAPPPSI
jgi:hypothetical protein